MSPEKISEHEPTAVEKSNDQRIVEKGEIGVDFSGSKGKNLESGITKT
jgi:hypothetical protein